MNGSKTVGMGSQEERKLYSSLYGYLKSWVDCNSKAKCKHPNFSSFSPNCSALNGWFTFKFRANLFHFCVSFVKFCLIFPLFIIFILRCTRCTPLQNLPNHSRLINYFQTELIQFIWQKFPYFPHTQGKS